VTLERFLSEREGGWRELEALLGRARGKPERLGADGVRTLGARYRAVAADLAFARRAFPGDPVVARLERLTLQARPAVYADEPGRQSLLAFLTTGYYRRVLERPGLLGLAALLLLVPLALCVFWGLDDPASAIGVVPDEFQGGGEPGSGSGAGSLSTAQEAAFSAQILTNNIRVGFLAVAGGMLAGLGTAAVTVYNGVFIGALIGLYSGGDDAGRFFSLIIPHGVLELSTIIVMASAGLRIGWAMIAPGTLTRMQSLQAEARPALELVLGTIPWVVLAGLVEGFVTGSAPSLTAAVVVGVALGVLYWGVIAWRGRARPQSRAAALAVR
jgi:uncharacterized membrane protein SpoIIM required for sporulation